MKFTRALIALATVMTMATVSAPHAGGTVSTGSDGPFAGAIVSELIAPKPDWYTDALHTKVVAAGKQGESVPIPDAVDYPTSGLAFTGIRPGAWIIAPAGCTTNFVFGSAGNYSIGTAGHCTEVGDEVTLIAAPGVLMNIGETVKSVDNGIGNDFALIDIYPAMQQYVTPSMAYFGGPTSKGDPRFGDLVEHAGHGLVIGTGGTPRAGVVVYRGSGENGGDAFAWDGAATPGDSGSAVREATGEAAGNLTHLVVGDKYAPGVVAGTSIDRMLRIAGKPLATAPNLPNPLY
ncbi:hypothetical protein [Haloechinothrix salitolerans]|uniref:Trypsin n=1 Tax=Haloechinothrix salitolerans TaxID=926830 RepID=A0ABW2C468_9PSEU